MKGNNFSSSTILDKIDGKFSPPPPRPQSKDGKMARQCFGREWRFAVPVYSVLLLAAVADPGEGPGGGPLPLIFRGNYEARRAGKKFFGGLVPRQLAKCPATTITT